MPIYVYQCAECGCNSEEFQHMQDVVLTQCPVCRCNRFQRVPTIPHSTQKEFAKPIEMHSVAYAHPDDVADFKRRHPDVQCSTNERDPLFGVPIAKSRAEKVAILKKEGFRELN